MNKLMPKVASVGLLIFALAVGAIVLSLSYRALGLIFPSDLFDQIIGLMLFDAAALIWFVVFVYLCESSMQYVYALFGFLIGLGGAVGLIAIEVGVSSGTLDAAEMVKPLTYIFIGVAVAHVVLLYARHASSPEVSAKISLGFDKAGIVDEGKRQATEQLKLLYPQLGMEMANKLVSEVVRDLNLITDPAQVIDLPALNVEPVADSKVGAGATDFLSQFFRRVAKGERKYGSNVQSVQPNSKPLTQMPSPVQGVAGPDDTADNTLKA